MAHSILYPFLQLRAVTKLCSMGKHFIGGADCTQKFQMSVWSTSVGQQTQQLGVEIP